MKKKSDFVHLHIHSQYSLLDGSIIFKPLLTAAKKFQMSALALTDHGNLFGAIEFYQETLRNGIKPIIGYEAYIAPGSRLDKKHSNNSETAYHLTLLVKNEQGYHNLLQLASLAYLEGFYYKPRIDKETLSRHKDGLICLSGCLHSEIASLLVKDQFDQAIKCAAHYKEIFDGDFYLELQNHRIKDQLEVNKGQLEISRQLNIPVVATNDVHYLRRVDARVHDVLLCIATNKMVKDPNRLRMSTDEFYFKSSDEMRKLFGEIPDAINNSLSIAEQCNLELRFGEYHLPKFTLPAGLDKTDPAFQARSSFDFISKLCDRNLKKRYTVVTDAIRQRLDVELDVVKKMGLVDYFLICWDCIQYAKSHHISVGPGRGSAAGSLLSYLLGITDVDPLKYDLIFERFMNPGRKELPDVDIDFSQEGRDDVIDYMRRKYGQNNVAQIITFGTMKARAAVRDVGRVMGIPFMEVDRLAKKIPDTLGITLKEALEADQELKSAYQTKSETKELFDISMSLEGLVRHASTHAAGVVIADKPLVSYVPLYSSAGVITTQYPMGILTKVGLHKIDMLALTNLLVIDTCLEIIADTTGEKLELSSLPLDDKETYTLLARGDSKGVFQLESAGMRDLLRKMRPDAFEDLIALLSMYRPGPLKSGMVDVYIRRKHKEEETTYLHSDLEPILKETNGVILYQEQVMRIANRLANFTLTEADALRQAMGKKTPDLILRYRSQFVKGAARNNIKETVANQIFDLMEYFAGYGFNKSHSTAYALTSYRTAYLKAHYPVEYISALLTTHRNNTDKIVEYKDECKRLEIEVLPPDVNESKSSFTVVPIKKSAKSSQAISGRIRFGLSAVKNVGEKAVTAIIEARSKDGKFRSLYDFCERVDLRAVDKLVVESFIKCGAFDSFGARRAQLYRILEDALKIGSTRQHEQRVGQLNLLVTSSQDDESSAYPPLPDEPEWPEEQLLSYEKDTLGFYITSHPLVKYEKVINDLSTTSVSSLPELKEGINVKIGGIITAIQSSLRRGDKGKSEKRILFKFRDLSGTVDAIIYQDGLKKYRDIVQKDKIVFIKGRLEFPKGVPFIKVKDVAMVDRAYEELATSVTIDLSTPGLEDWILQGLQDVFLAHPGNCPVYFRLTTPENQHILIKTGADYSISPSKRFIGDVDELLGSGHLVFNQK